MYGCKNRGPTISLNHLRAQLSKKNYNLRVKFDAFDVDVDSESHEGDFDGGVGSDPLCTPLKFGLPSEGRAGSRVLRTTGAQLNVLSLRLGLLS